jgi:hypothetical protein
MIIASNHVMKEKIIAKDFFLFVRSTEQFGVPTEK